MRLPGAILILMAGMAAAYAQTPFDMSPERPPEATVPRPVAPPQSSTPQPPATGAVRRYLLPQDPMVFEGEVGARSWAVHLTDAEAASPATLHLAYQNAIVVAPEASRLIVSINGTAVIDESISSSQAMKKLTAELPPQTLRPGRNDVSVRVHQRHRTDCTVESTYELWTELDAPDTFVEFAGGEARRLGGFQDLRAIGGDPSGKAIVTIVAPALDRTDMRAHLMTLAQSVGLYLNLPDVDFIISDKIPDDDRSTLRILAGTLEELHPLGGQLLAGSDQGPTAAFMEVPAGQPPTLVVTGRSVAEWSAAVEQLRAPVDRPAGMLRQAIVTHSWRTPDAPMMSRGGRIPFSQLGVRSEQFSGRRYHTSFQFGIPSDFYASSYGQAQILLDAAYARSVLPGSMINIHVNGNIAATVPITSGRGAILNKYPVKVTMRHFRPGLNEITIDVELRTEQDSVCLPGAADGNSPRFALFGTSEFVVPDFARIAQRPNLSAVAGTGFPYNLSPEPVALVTERSDMDTLAATADLLSRMALSAGRPIPVTFTTTADGARAGNALFVGPLGSVSPTVLAQVGVDPDRSRAAWSPDASQPEDDAVNVDNWRRQVQDSWLHAVLSDFQNWMSDTFNITIDMLRFAPSRTQAFVPAGSVALMVAQGENPARNGVWTVVTAPDAATLRHGVSGLSQQANWSRLSGAITTLGRDRATMESLPVSTFSFSQTQPMSFSNYRLIIANWLSSNILSYSLVLVVACVLLGFFTSIFLSGLGRKR